MGIIRKAVLGVFVGGAAAAGYIGGATTIISPLPVNDAIWTSKIYKRMNGHENPATNDVCLKTVPLDKIRPELLQKEGDLALEFCRGVWSGWGYEIQRRYLERKYYGPETSKQLWSREQLAASAYDAGTHITDHFEVLERTPTGVTVRCGDSPRTQDPRGSDGIFVIAAEVDRGANVAHFALKSVFFPTNRRADAPPMPLWMEILHQWYARIWMVSGVRRVLR